MSHKDKIDADHKVFSYAHDFLENIPQQKLFHSDHVDLESFQSFMALRKEGQPIDGIMERLHQYVIQPGLHPTSGTYLAYIPGGGIYASALGDYLAAVSNKFAGLYFAAPGAVRLENELVRWTGEVLGFTGNFGGHLSSGGSIANLSAISTARWAKGIKGKDLEKTVIYLSKQSHHSVEKALRISGLHECILRYLPLDARFRIVPEDFRNLVESDREAGLLPFLAVANAGTTNVGSVDPMDAMAEICQQYEIWLHVDAAYGGYFALTKHGKRKFKGIDKADSLTVDPHKGLFLPYGTGIVLVKDVKSLKEANQYQAEYLQDTLDFNADDSPAELSPELSKHFRGLRMYLPLQLHGLDAYVAALNEKLLLTQYFYQEVQKIGFAVGPEPELSVCIFRLNVEATLEESNVRNKEMVEALQSRAKVYVSSTSINNTYWVRCAILSFRTHKEHIDILLDELAVFSAGVKAEQNL